MIGTVDNNPIIAYNMPDGIYSCFYCPHCGVRHYHGKLPTDGTVIHRAAHSKDASSPYRSEGYFLRVPVET
jgi:predicted RNA-binding Zn-ribbon protein involved in translation (DUF1610 family)